jgi:hypothetical protein
MTYSALDFMPCDIDKQRNLQIAWVVKNRQELGLGKSWPNPYPPITGTHHLVQPPSVVYEGCRELCRQHPQRVHVTVPRPHCGCYGQQRA